MKYNKFNSLALLALGCMLLNSCQIDIDFPGGGTGLNSSSIIGQWKCGNAKIEGFDSLDGESFIYYNNGGDFKIEYRLSQYGILNTHPNADWDRVLMTCSGEWIFDAQNGKVFTTATFPESFRYGNGRTYHLSHGGENIVFRNIEKPDPITLVIDGYTYTKQ